MKKIFKIIIILVVLGLIAYMIWSPRPSRVIPSDSTATTTTAMFANGCFWCVEADLEKVPGVIKAVSGYAGGMSENPTYKNYRKNGHREVVEVTYDPTQVSYGNLVEHILKHGDPTDAEGSFHDRGPEYAPAIYYETEEEKNQALDIIKSIEAKKVYSKPISVPVIPRVKFWPAEEYHQDYYLKNPLRYKYYRHGSGRDAFIEKYWGAETDRITTASTTYPWQAYQKPTEEKLRKLLTPLQYKVTQEDGTEPPFNNEYDKNTAAGIYVDIISSEPLYSSKDKYDSGTGWPSFVKPITVGAVVLKEDRSIFGTRIEVRSRYADSHLGHVFDDGPKERGGKRYCMNSAAMRFIPIENMVAEGYGDFVKFVE